MLKRQLWDIYADMLTESLKPVNKTRVMYRCNLNYRQLTKHLCTLVEKGFVGVKTNPHRVFRTTEKGREWLKIYKQLHKLTSPTFFML